AVTADGASVVYYHYEHDRSNRGYGCRKWAPEGELPARWDVPTFLDPKGGSRTFGFVLLDDGERMLTTEREGSSTHLCFRSLAKGKKLTSADIGNYDHPTVAASPDSSMFVVLSKKVLAIFSEPKLKAPVSTIQGGGKTHFTGIAFHPSGKFLAATNNDK